MATSYYFWGTSKSGFANRDRKDSLLMHASISAMFSLFFLPLSFSSFFLLFLVFQFTPGLLWLALFSLPLCSLSFFSLFFLLLVSCYYLTLSSSPFSSMATSPFYSKLIQWDFSLLPLGLHQLFLVCCGHSFRTAHQLIAYSATTIAQYVFAAPLLISWQNFLLFVLVVYLYL